MCPKKKSKKVKKEGEMKSSANIIIYFNRDVLNTNEGVTLVCERPSYFFFNFLISFTE